jgi:hypothetical protein
MTQTEKDIRTKISSEIAADLRLVIENCICLGRDAYGDYTEKMIAVIQNKILNTKG